MTRGTAAHIDGAPTGRGASSGISRIHPAPRPHTAAPRADRVVLVACASRVMTVLVARRFVTRLRGLIGRERAPLCDCLLFPACSSVHTWGMRRPIDLAFVDERNRVIETVRRLPPGRMVRCSRACAVLERVSSESPWFAVGSRIRVVTLGCR